MEAVPASIRPWRRPDGRLVAGMLGRIVLFLAAVAVLGWAIGRDAGGQMRELLGRHAGGVVLVVCIAAYGLFSIAVNLIRLVLVLKYRSLASPGDDLLPSITVLVPAYNEGELVRHTLHSLAASRYPAAKMQLIAIDDGSADDTWLHIRLAAAELGDRLAILRCRRNGGKRRALYRGLKLARGDVVVTVDSDSLVEPDTLRNLVAPLAADPRIGAVAGNVRVLNRDAGWIPRLLSVSFVFAFDFVRAAESVLGTVLCTPGALSAYRVSAVRPVLRRWLRQTYFGRPATIGEDRALTNMILAQGYRVAYQSNAHVLTKVPTRFGGLRRMFTRWARSDVRESLAFARFAFRPLAHRARWEARLIRLNFLSKVGAFTLAWPLLAALLALAAVFPAVVGLKVLAGAIVGSLWTLGICWFRGRRADAVLAIPYAIFWLAALWWITPWGLLTSHRNGWLTRSLRPRTPDPFGAGLAGPPCPAGQTA